MRTTPTLAVLCLGALVALTWGPSPGWAHNPRPPSPGSTVGRYQLAKYWLGTEVRVLDRQTGRLYCLDPERGEALLVDPLGGASVSKPLARTEVRPLAGGLAPAWPPRDAGGGAPRFVGIGEHDGSANSIEAGATPVLFDVDTGRIYKVLTPTEVEILDPVEARITRQKLRLRDGTKLAKRMTKTRNEHRAVSALIQLRRAELRFRDLDPEKDGRNDYGTLKELGAAKLIPVPLSQGKQDGYTFTVQLDPAGQVFLATASPTEPGKTGARHFAISERGVPYWRATPIPLTDACRIPEDAKRVDGKPDTGQR